jgi:hypothetical protein
MPTAQASKPSAWRWQHGRVTRVAEQIADVDGAIGQPYQAEGLLGMLERRGDITRYQRLAGEEFARLFYDAHLEPLRAADVSRTPSGRSRVPESFHGPQRSRERILGAMQAMGGHGSPIGSAAWHVIGGGMSMGDWARREGWNGRPIGPEVAKGLVVGALGVLEMYFGY